MASQSPSKRNKNKLTLNMQDADGETHGKGNNDEEIHLAKENEKKPKKRALGGVWLNTSDFPHSFQHVIVYHNMKSFQHTELYTEFWTNPNQTFTSNEKDIYIKFDLNEDSFNKWRDAHKLDATLTLKDIIAGNKPA